MSRRGRDCAALGNLIPPRRDLHRLRLSNRRTPAQAGLTTGCLFFNSPIEQTITSTKLRARAAEPPEPFVAWCL